MSREPAVVDFATLRRGDQVPAFELRISAEDVAAYIEATGAPPEHGGERVPPLALGALVLAGLMEHVSVPAGLVHTGQEYEFHRAARCDEPLDIRIEVASRLDRQGAVVIAFQTSVRGGRGEPVASGRTTVMLAEGVLGHAE